jgi:hypothetical protein
MTTKATSSYRVSTDSVINVIAVGDGRHGRGLGRKALISVRVSRLEPVALRYPSIYCAQSRSSVCSMVDAKSDVRLVSDRRLPTSIAVLPLQAV